MFKRKNDKIFFIVHLPNERFDTFYDSSLQF